VKQLVGHFVVVVVVVVVHRVNLVSLNFTRLFQRRLIK